MRKSWHFGLPKTKEELFHNYTHNPDLTVFTSTRDGVQSGNYKYKFGNEEGLRAALIRSRIEESLTSGAPMSIINAGIISNVKVVLPYSSELLIPFFMNLKTTAKDIFYPKNIIHKFVNANIKNIGQHDLRPKNDPPTYHAWVVEKFPKTKLGKSLAKLDSGLNSTTATPATPALKLSYELSYNWKKHVMKTIEDKNNER